MTTIGPHNITSDEWLILDPIEQPKSALNQSGMRMSRSQGIAVQVISYRAGRYTVRDANGYTFRARRAELSDCQADKAARATRQEGEARLQARIAADMAAKKN